MEGGRNKHAYTTSFSSGVFFYSSFFLFLCVYFISLTLVFYAFTLYCLVFSTVLFLLSLRLIACVSTNRPTSWKLRYLLPVFFFAENRLPFERSCDVRTYVLAGMVWYLGGCAVYVGVDLSMLSALLCVVVL